MRRYFSSSSSSTPPSLMFGFSSSTSSSPSTVPESWLFPDSSPPNSPFAFSPPTYFSNDTSSTVSSASEKPCCDSTAFGPNATSSSTVISAFSEPIKTSTNTFTFPRAPFESSSTSSAFLSTYSDVQSASAPASAASCTITANPNPTTVDFPINSSSSSFSTITASTSSLSGISSASTCNSQPQSIVSAPLDVNEPAGGLPESQEVAAILASQCEKFLSYRADRQTQGGGQMKMHISAAHTSAFGTTAPQATGSSKPVNDAAHTPAATGEQKYGESDPCSALMTGAPLTSTPSARLDSKSGSSLLPSLQPAEEEKPYFPCVDLLHSTIEMWERVIANKKTDQEVAEEGLRHFYEGINYFCLQSERLQVATAKYNEVVKASDDLKTMMAPLKDELGEAYRKLENSEKEKERLEHELARAANMITALTGEKDSLFLVQTLLGQKIVELVRELEEAGPAAIQKYKASSLYKQELMEYAAPYMGKGVKLAIEKIKAKDPTFDPKTYALDVYMLPPEANDKEFSSSEEGDER